MDPSYRSCYIKSGANRRACSLAHSCRLPCPFFNQHWYRLVLLFIDFCWFCSMIGQYCSVFCSRECSSRLQASQASKVCDFYFGKWQNCLRILARIFPFYLWLCSCLFVPIASGTSLLAFSYSKRSRPSSKIWSDESHVNPSIQVIFFIWWVGQKYESARTPRGRE